MIQNMKVVWTLKFYSEFSLTYKSWINDSEFFKLIHHICEIDQLRTGLNGKKTEANKYECVSYF